MRRANICVSFHSFGRQDVGKKIYAGNGDVILQITGETKPCSRMDEVVPGLRKALESNWRGGVTCRVICGGDLRLNESAFIE
jgi:MOSC domain-containing protein YiiM